MAMSITIAINVDENQRFTPVESAVIEALQQGTSRVTAAADQAAIEPTPAAEEKPKRAPRKPAQSTRAAVLEDTPEPETVEAPAAVEEPAVQQLREEEGTDEVPDEQAIIDAVVPAGEVTFEEAVSIATAAIGNGGKGKVKAALETLGVAKVTELKENPEGLAKLVALIQAD